MLSVIASVDLGHIHRRWSSSGDVARESSRRVKSEDMRKSASGSVTGGGVGHINIQVRVDESGSGTAHSHSPR